MVGAAAQVDHAGTEITRTQSQAKHAVANRSNQTVDRIDNRIDQLSLQISICESDSYVRSAHIVVAVKLERSRRQTIVNRESLAVADAAGQCALDGQLQSQRLWNGNNVAAVIFVRNHAARCV